MWKVLGWSIESVGRFEESLRSAELGQSRCFFVELVCFCEAWGVLWRSLSTKAFRKVLRSCNPLFKVCIYIGASWSQRQWAGMFLRS